MWRDLTACNHLKNAKTFHIKLLYTALSLFEPFGDFLVLFMLLNSYIE